MLQNPLTLSDLLKISGVVAVAAWFSSCDYLALDRQEIFNEEIKFKGTLSDTLFANGEKGTYDHKGRRDLYSLPQQAGTTPNFPKTI